MRLLHYNIFFLKVNAVYIFVKKTVLVKNIHTVFVMLLNVFKYGLYSFMHSVFFSVVDQVGDLDSSQTRVQCPISLTCDLTRL